MATVVDDAITANSVTRQLQASTDDQRYWASAQQRNNDGANLIVERLRYSAGYMASAVDAFTTQAILGTNPTLADLTLAMRSVAAQPQTTGALINPGVVQGQPTSGTGANPNPGKTTTAPAA